MSKELPYFKFITSDWINGDITLEDYAVQGVFINICAYYWSKECLVSLDVLKRRFKAGINEIDTLVALNIIKVDSGNVIINFLDEQFSERENLRKVNSENGKKGGAQKGNSNAKKTTKTSEKQPTARFETSEIQAKTSNIEERREEDNKKREEGKGSACAHFTPPLVFDVELFFKDKMPETFWDFAKCKTEAQAFFDYYQKTDWKTKAGPITNWQSAAAGWIRNDGKFASEKKNKPEQSSTFPNHYNQKYMESLTPPAQKQFRAHLNSIGIFYTGRTDPRGNPIWEHREQI